MYRLIWCFLLFIVLPLGCGGLFLDFNSYKNRLYGCAVCELFGFIWMLALYLPLAVVTTLVCGPLHVLTIVWGLFVTASACVGYFFLFKQRNQIFPFEEKKKGIGETVRNVIKSPETYLLVVLILLIAVQIIAVCFFQHIDEDDFTYVSIATTSRYTDTVGVYNDLGNVSDWRSMLPYSMSPFSVWCASVSQIIQVHPAIFMHTVLPVILIVMAYIAYSYIGYTFFENNMRNVIKFCIIYALLNIMGGFSVRSVGMFLLTRPWQGKAVATVIFMPLLFAFANNLLADTQKKSDYILMLCTNMAIVLCSGMGIFQGGAICGCFMLTDLIKHKSIKRVALECTVLLPNLIVFGLNHI